MSYYHGIADAMGVFKFVRTFLYFYARSIGMTMPDGENVAEELEYQSESL